MDPQTMAQHAWHNKRALQDLLDGISPQTQKSIIRESSSKAVLYLSEQHPEVLLYSKCFGGKTLQGRFDGVQVERHFESKDT